MTTTLTFRDFAGALMGGDPGRASEILRELLDVDAAVAGEATRVFGEKLAAGPAFVQKAMSMRAAVEQKDAAALSALISECFGLSPAVAATSAATVLARHA